MTVLNNIKLRQMVHTNSNLIDKNAGIVGSSAMIGIQTPIPSLISFQWSLLFHSS
jgi:phosphohistidine swiveling domain-containing protein